MLKKSKDKAYKGKHAPKSEQEGHDTSAPSDGKQLVDAEKASQAASSSSGSDAAAAQSPMDSDDVKAASGNPASSTTEMPYVNQAYSEAGAAVMPAQFGMQMQKKAKRKPGKIAAVVFGVIFGVLALVYLAGVLVFSGRFFPNTYAGDLDFSLKSVSEVQQQLTDLVADYELSVSGMGFSLELSAEETGLTADVDSIVSSMHDDLNPWTWPAQMFSMHDETAKLAANYNQSGLDETLRATVDEFNADKVAPVNATIAFDDAAGEFVVQPEQAGTMVDADALIALVDASIVSLEEKATVTSEQLQKPTVLSSDPALQEAADQANTMIGADVEFTLGGEPVAEVDASLISQWITLGEDLSATLDQNLLTAWVDELIAQCNTVGSERTYTRPDGKEITISGGSYGWEIDRDTFLAQVQEAVSAATVATQEIPCLTSAAVFNGAGERDWGSRYCDIDLSEQYVRFYDENGTLVWESDCISGTPTEDRATPTGVYKINAKESPSTLIGYENGEKTYETPVEYWMPFVRNSVGLHDANWQSSFGGTRYKDGYGSHGCINLPVSKAAELYDIIQVGDCVVCHW